MNEICECSLIILTEDQNHGNCTSYTTWSNWNFIKTQSLLQTLNSCKFNLWGLFFFLGKNFWILSSILTLSFIHNFAPKKIKPKTMDRKTKAFTGKLPCSSPSRIQVLSKEAPPTESLVCKKIVHGGNHVRKCSS